MWPKMKFLQSIWSLRIFKVLFSTCTISLLCFYYVLLVCFHVLGDWKIDNGNSFLSGPVSHIRLQILDPRTFQMLKMALSERG